MNKLILLLALLLAVAPLPVLALPKVSRLAFLGLFSPSDKNDTATKDLTEEEDAAIDNLMEQLLVDDEDDEEELEEDEEWEDEWEEVEEEIEPEAVALPRQQTVSTEADSSKSSGSQKSRGSSTSTLCEVSQIDLSEHGPLLQDIELLSGILAEVVQRENPRVHDLYKTMREYGLERALHLADGMDETDGSKALEKMVQLAESLDSQDALGVMRTFGMALNLVNAAEVHHKMRQVREHATDVVGPLPFTDDSIPKTFEALLGNVERKSQEEVFEQLVKQKVELVLTAHPTEVNRRTHLRKYKKVSEILSSLDRKDLPPFERSECMVELRRIISSLWGSDEIRRRKPTPQQEALGGVAIIESVLWEAVPAYLRKLDAQCRISLGQRLPIDVTPIKFASWIGGDRDGNPNVTPAVTLEIVTMQRLRAAKLLLNDFNELYSELAISSRYSPEMEELAGKIVNSPDVREKYRRVIGHLRKRLKKTVKICEEELSQWADSNDPIARTTENLKTVEAWEDAEPILKAKDLMDPLLVMHNSLSTTGFELVADGLLLDIIRRVETFGMTLVPLDIREESTKHTMAIDAITRYLGIGAYAQWDEETKLNYLQAELAGKRPLLRTLDFDKCGFTDEVVTTLKTFKMASTLQPESLGAYVISQAQTASDVVAVMLLQQQFGMTSANGNMMRVVPLFETLSDLENAPDTLDTLFNVAMYAGSIKSSQEVMVGYSDSAKDAGRLAACWAQYNSQERMAAVAAKHHVEITFFHGKGGTVGRGGNPALYRAILSHPPKTINGRFRVTEQGEMITKNFGNPAIAERTLDIYTAAVLREAFVKQVRPTKHWRDQMAKVSQVSCDDYRFLVREEPRFVPYFRQATPELELGSLNIGSRPAKRNPKGGIESLRAIPWTFAWTQTRTHLSAWLGVGAGLTPQTDQELETFREMYSGWPWFRETIDLLAMILSKTDFSISANYDKQLVDKTEDLIGLGNEVRKKLVQTRQAVLDITQSQDVAGAHVALLRASSTIRHPYVDPVNVVQAELLKRLRALEQRGDLLSPEEAEEQETLKDALIVSITGVAEGMRNSG